MAGTHPRRHKPQQRLAGAKAKGGLVSSVAVTAGGTKTTSLQAAGREEPAAPHRHRRDRQGSRQAEPSLRPAATPFHLTLQLYEGHEKQRSGGQVTRDGKEKILEK